MGVWTAGAEKGSQFFIFSVDAVINHYNRFIVIRVQFEMQNISNMVLYHLFSRSSTLPILCTTILMFLLLLLYLTSLALSPTTILLVQTQSYFQQTWTASTTLNSTIHVLWRE